MKIKRSEILKVTKRNSTKYERRFMELLKNNRIPFRTKVIIGGREVDFLVDRYAIDIDGHEQDGDKNSMLVREGYTPIHYNNSEIRGLNINYLKQWV